MGICIEKGARSFLGKSERNGCFRYYKARRSCLSMADTTVVSDIIWHDFRVPNHFVQQNIYAYIEISPAQ